VILSFVGGVLVAGIGGFFLAPALMGIVVGVYQVQKEETGASGEAVQVAEESIDWAGDEEAPDEKESLREAMTETEEE